MPQVDVNTILKILVTMGLGVGYCLTIRDEINRGEKQSALGNSVLLPASLVWLWLVSSKK
jgi:hypothetical protein